MRTLSQAAEEKLLAAIEKAAAYVNDGMAPNAAIIKSASESNIPAGHINLMVHAYNTGRTTKQRESGENTLEKAADFALADADTVLEALFPKQVKTSQAIEREAVVSTEYAISPKGMLARRREQQQKAASAQHTWPASTYVRPPRDDKEEARRQYSSKVAEQREYEELRRVANAEYQKAAAAMEELHTYFRRPGNMSFNDAIAETELRVGTVGVAVLKKIAAVYPHLEKQAATNLAHFGTCEPCELVIKVLNAVEQYNAAQKQAELKKKPIVPQFSKKKASEFITESILASDEPLTLKQASPPPDATPPTPESVLPEAAINPIGTIAKTLNSPAGVGGVRGITSSIARTMTTPASPEEIKTRTHGAFKTLTDPDHELQLRNIRAKSVLNDLIRNDSVISSYDPNEVTLGFNEISEVAPSVAESPAIMTALLRKRLEGGQLADFDISQLMQMEKAKAEAQNLQLNNKRVQRELID